MKRTTAGDPQILESPIMSKIPMKKCLKPVRVPACLIKIGSWQKEIDSDAEISVQCCFGQKKLRWDVQMDDVICRIEITWSNISAMRTYCKDGKIDALEIELHRKPYFFVDSLVGSSNQSRWSPIPDFTGGQASICRRHYLEFHSGRLDMIYGKLVENNLLEQSRQQFPNHNSEYFPDSIQASQRNLPSNSMVKCIVHPTRFSSLPTSPPDHHVRAHPTSSLTLEPDFTTPSIFSHQPSPSSVSELHFRVGLLETPCLDMFVYPQMIRDAHRMSRSQDTTNTPEMHLPVCATFGDAPQYQTHQTTYDSPASPSLSELLEMAECLRVNSSSHHNTLRGSEGVETDPVGDQVEDNSFMTRAADPYDGLLESVIRPYFDIKVAAEAPSTSQAPLRDFSREAALHGSSTRANVDPVDDCPGPSNY